MTSTTPTRTAVGGLDIAAAIHRGSLDVHVEATVAADEVVAVVGPNGAGKSTLLHAVAGLLPIAAGRIALDGRTLEDPSTGVRVPAEHRDIGMVFQDYLLFDHLSVRDNVAFSPRSRGRSRRDAGAIADRWLDRVGLGDLADRRPARLSGGQRQRVALARALAAEPACLLLDEPLAALDVETRSTIRRELRQHLHAFDGPVLLVTHEPLEALALADRLVVIEDGHITQVGDAATVARHPRSDWVARLVGLNLLTGTAAEGAVTIDGGGTVRYADDDQQGAVFVTVHPRSISLHRAQPAGSPRNVWSGRVEDVEVDHDRVRVAVHSTPPMVAEVTAAALTELDLAAGGEVWLSFKAADVAVYPR